MNQITEELTQDPEKLKDVIGDLCDIVGKMSLSYLTTIVRNQQTTIDRQELQIASLKRQVKSMEKTLQETAIAVQDEARKRETAVNVLDERLDRAAKLMRTKSDGEGK